MKKIVTACWIIMGAIFLAPIALADICLQANAAPDTIANNAVRSITFTNAGNFVSNDLVVVVISSNAPVTITAPTGWIKRTPSSGNSRQSIFYKLATVTDMSTASFTFSNNSATQMTGGMAIFRGVDTTSPIDYNAAPITGSSDSYTTGTALASSTNSWIVGAFTAAEGNRAITVNSGLTSISASHTKAGPNGVTSAIGYKIQNLSGSVASLNATGPNTNYVATTLVIKSSGNNAVCGTAAIDHYRFELNDSEGITCASESITIKACADSRCSSLYSGSSTITPSASNGGNWSSITSFTGSTTATITKRTIGITTLGISSVTPAATNPLQCSIAGVLGSCTINFVDSGFIWNFPTSNVSNGTHFLTANKTLNGVTLQAVRTDATTQNCAPAFTGIRPISLSSSYISPATGTLPVYINGLALNNAQNLSFDATATAIMTVQYADAGQLQLSAYYAGSSTTGDTGLSVSGSTSAISLPAGFCIQALDNSSTPIAACTSSNCPAYKRAGENFPLRINAVAWEIDGENGEQLCNSNRTTPNFNSTINLSSLMSDGGANGSLARPSAALINGTLTQTSQQLSEVGRFTITPSGNYFGLALPATASAVIGRITPYQYGVTIDTYTAACNGFTYGGDSTRSGQAFSLQTTVVAQNAAGATTSNYQGAYATLNGNRIDFVDWLNGVNYSLGDFIATHTLNFSNGVAVVAPPSPTYQFSSNSPNPDLHLHASVNDSDNISGEATSANSINFRMGRFWLDNAYGPELLPLTIPLRTEYFNGTRYVTNTLDHCTLYHMNNAGLNSFTGNLANGETTINSPAAGTALVNGVYASGSPLQLSAPGPGNDGSVRVQFTVPTWLQFNWDGTGPSNPAAVATFGRYRGADRVIYWKEKR